MKKVTVSVPGKIHLMGEHAVVYGKPALLAAVNLRMSVSIEEASKDAIGDDIRDTVAFLMDQLKIKDQQSVKITIDSQIPSGYHLGSSAAVAAGLSGAVMYFFKTVWNPMRINELAYEIEKKHHGNPSGGDNTAVTMGGYVWYRKEMEFLRSIWQLPMKPTFTRFYLLDTGRPKETTKEMVALVGRKHNLQNIFDENETQTRRMAIALKTNDEALLLDAMKKGERTLERIGVVSDKAMNIIRGIEKSGGAAKILGGGGKTDGVGYLLCYLPTPLKNSIPIILGEEGIRLEQKQ